MRVRFSIVLVLLCLTVIAEERRGGDSVYDKYPLVKPIAGEEEEDFEKSYELYKEMFTEEGGELRVRAYGELTAMRRARRPRNVRPNDSGETDANGCAWVSAGPTNINGRVTSIAIDPNDGNRIYATTVGGIWRSLDAGRRWERVSDDFLSTVFSSIAVNPSTPSEILAGGGDSSYHNATRGGIGIWRSDNYGAPGSWTKVSPQDFDNKVIYRIRFDPAPPNNVYVASSHGVWLGTHNANGITFDKIGGFHAAATDLVVDFLSTPRRVYAGVRSGNATYAAGIWKSDGTGPNATWLKKDGGIPTADVKYVALAWAKSSPSTLYARMVQSDGQQQGIYKTTVGGEGANAWGLLQDAAKVNDSGNANTFWYSWYNNVIEVDPTDAEHVYAGGLNIYRSTTGGMGWEKISAGQDPNYPYWTHADHHAIAFDPANPKIVYVGNDGGIDKSTDLSKAVWHWRDASHGMVMTEFYYMTSNHQYPTLLAGGSQDNGTEITFGNRTWYNPGGCDGYQVGSDAINPDTLYANCNGNVYELSNPVPGTNPGLPTTVVWDSGDWDVLEPAATDRLYAGGAIAGGDKPCEERTVLKTTDGVKWDPTNTDFPPGGMARVLASASVANFQTYMAAVVYSPPSAEDCPDFQGKKFDPIVYRTDDGGGLWTSSAVGLPALMPHSIVFDPNDQLRVYISYGNGGLYMTWNAKHYHSIVGSGATGLPPSARVKEVAVDPNDENVVYAATSVGVFRGVITLAALPSQPPSAVWTEFDEGMPDGTLVFGIWADPTTGILHAATFGHGMYRRDIRQNVTCPARMLLVRDNVYDDGDAPSPFGVPDAEHPIPILGTQFYKPDDTEGGLLYWWASRDIRIDDPSSAPYKNTIANADHLEFEVCPPTIAECPAGTMIDAPPKSGKKARVYVQVQNRGVEPVANTRVIAIWAPTSAGLPPLPPTFWSTTFPANGPCGAIDPSTGWQLLDAANPCREIPMIHPEMPELARFDWFVPLGVDGHACILTVVESPEDPLEPNIRAWNLVAPIDFVPFSRHVAQRNLTVKPFKPFPSPILFPIQIINPPEERGSELIVSKVDLKESVLFALPKGMKAKATFGAARATKIEGPEDLVREIEAMGLDPNNAWELSGDEAGLFVEMRPGERATLGVVGTPGSERASTRFSVMQRAGRTVHGGNVYLFRPEPQQ